MYVKPLAFLGMRPSLRSMTKERKKQKAAAVVSRVRQLRDARGLNLEELAVAAGLSRSRVHLVERAPNLLTDRTAEALAKVLGVKPEELRP
jgi:ribosome-binding protein aMBF1 (putative translation factor)